MSTVWEYQYKGHRIKVENSWFGGEKLFIDGRQVKASRDLLSGELRARIESGEGRGHEVVATLKAALISVQCRVTVNGAELRPQGEQRPQPREIAVKVGDPVNTEYWNSLIRGSTVRDDDISWLFPPSDVHDPAVWDRYWNAQVSHGLGPPMFDLFLHDELLVRTLAENGVKTILCVGSGISQEPRALAAAGFEVTAADISPVAARLAESWESDPNEGFYPTDLRRPGGRLDFVVGDLMDLAICPGPYDTIVERRTLQVFPPQERAAALAAIEKRLQPNGIFMSHCHDNRWKPPATPVHPIEPLLRESGWTMWPGHPNPKPKGRVAWTRTTTG